MTIALIAAAAAVVALAVVAVSLMLLIRSERRRHERERAQLWRQFEVMTDRNMHLTDGGAYSAAKELRPSLDNDAELVNMLTLGVRRDPENGVPDEELDYYDTAAALEGAASF